MQKHIAAWLAQFALSHCIVMRLPKCPGPITYHQGTDNSAADAASAKGLSMTPAMSTVLSPFFMYMRRFHIPGHLNIIADALSRFQQPLQIPLKHDDFCDVDWQALSESSPVVIAQTGRKWPSHFGISMQKSRVCSSLTVFVNRTVFGGVIGSGWSILEILWCSV